MTVYGMILRSPGPRGVVEQMEADGSANSVNDEEGPKDTRIFAVNKQIHEEATDALFRENTVVVSLVDDGFLGLPPPIFRDDASNLQQAYLRKLRKVYIMIPLYKIPEARRLKWVFERVCQKLAQAAELEELRVNSCTTKWWYKPELDVAMDSVLEAVTLLQGMSRVVFSDQSEFGGELSESRVIGTQAQKDRLCSIVNNSK